MESRVPDVSFDVSVRNWAPNNEFAQRFNASSLGAPLVEPYVNRVMLLCKGKLAKSDVALRVAIDDFVRQESTHYRIHNQFNDRFRDFLGEDMLQLEREMKESYKSLLKDRSLAFNAAYAAGFESTALFLAEFFFHEIDDLLEGADPAVVGLFRWHLAEEYEHRSVCYDVYQRVFGGYFLRVRGTWYVFKHLGTFGQKMTTLLLERDRATMTAEERAASVAREKAYRKRFLRFVLPRMLHLLNPFYNPAKAKPPRGVIEILEGAVPLTARAVAPSALG